MSVVAILSLARGGVKRAGAKFRAVCGASGCRGVVSGRARAAAAPAAAPQRAVAADALGRDDRHARQPRPARPPSSRTALKTFAETALADADSNWKRADYPVLIVNALRMLVAVCPDYQTA